MPELSATNFGLLDGAIVAVYLVGVGIAGVAVNRYVRNVADFMVGGRASRASLNTATYIGTGLGLVTIMYASIDAFQRGFSYLMLPVLSLGITFFVGMTGFVVHPLRARALTTVPEFFEARFDRRTRVTAGAICALAGIVNMGLFPRMGATFITYATGLGGAAGGHMVDIITSVLIIVVLLYTTMGGMVSVIVTDYLQFVVLAVGMTLGLLVCLGHPGLDWDGLVSTLAAQRGEAAFNPVHPDSYGWIYMIWMVFAFGASTICWAPEVSRALTSRDPATAQRTFLLAAPSGFVRLAIPALWGIAAYCYFAKDPLLSTHFFPEGPAGEIAHADQAMPLLLGKIVPSGLLGILVAGLLAAFMSTHDSYLLCWSSVITRDCIAPLRRRPLSEREQIRITRIIIVAIGVFLLVWGIWYELPASVWTYMALTGNIYLSGATVALVGGLYWRRASRAGAFAALLGGLFSLAGVFGPQDPLTLAALGLGNCLLCAALFVVVSLLVPDRDGAAGREARP